MRMGQWGVGSAVCVCVARVSWRVRWGGVSRCGTLLLMRSVGRVTPVLVVWSLLLMLASRAWRLALVTCA